MGRNAGSCHRRNSSASPSSTPPIISLVVFSFNANRLVTVWSGFSQPSGTPSCSQDPQLLPAAWLQPRRSPPSPPRFALVLGTLCAVALVRFKPLPRPTPCSQATVSAPLVMPDVITGLALLLLCSSPWQTLIGWPRGAASLTIIIAHTTFCTAYVTVVVQSAPRRHRPEPRGSRDGPRRHAGARCSSTSPCRSSPRPWSRAGCSAFTLSLDDLVIASFVSGPGSSTLPMVIFSKISLGVSPDVNALATIIIGVVALGVVIATLIGLRAAGRARRRSKTDPLFARRTTVHYIRP